MTSVKTSKRRKRLSAGERRDLIERSAATIFAQRGYHHASIEEIARRAGVTPPVVYDHFDSKLALHRRLLERTRDELLQIWREHLRPEASSGERVARAFDAWARFVQANPYAPRMFFVETTGEPEIQAIHAKIQAEARAALTGLLAGESDAEHFPDQQALEMAVEVIRAGLTGLAVWWLDHPEVGREEIVRTAINSIWIGLERVSRGEKKWA